MSKRRRGPPMRIRQHTICWMCRPDRFPGPTRDFERKNDRHIGVRYGDMGRPMIVALDGEDVTEDCIEAMSGPFWGLLPGYVVTTAAPDDLQSHRCECDKGPAMWVRRGKVEVRFR